MYVFDETKNAQKCIKLRSIINNYINFLLNFIKNELKKLKTMSKNISGCGNMFSVHCIDKQKVSENFNISICHGV